MAKKTEKESRKIYSEDDPEIKLFIKYRSRLTGIGIIEIERGTRLQHAKWMCRKAQEFEDRLKMSRWIGWIQCCLVTENIYSLDQVMRHSREAFKDNEENQNH